MGVGGACLSNHLMEAWRRDTSADGVARRVVTVRGFSRAAMKVKTAWEVASFLLSNAIVKLDYKPSTASRAFAFSPFAD